MIMTCVRLFQSLLFLALATTVLACTEDEPKHYPGSCQVTVEILSQDVMAIDRVETKNWTDENLTRVDIDDGNDGTINEIETYTVDPATNLLVRKELDTDANGVVDTIEDYFYDQDTNFLVLKKVITDADTTPDWFYFYLNDSEGRLERLEVDQGADNHVDWVRAYTYNDDGSIYSIARDNENDGRVDEIYGFDYQYTKYTVTTLLDKDNNAIPDHVMVQRYDDGGNLQEETTDVDGDGVIDQRDTHTYDCW